VVADAKHQFLAQQAAGLDAYAKRGDCAHARDIVAKAKKLVPDDETLDAKAKACVPRTAPIGPVSHLDAAKEAYERHDYAKALELAEKAIFDEPASSDAIREAALAAC